MTQVGFYHLSRTPLERALPKLLEKVLESGDRAVVIAGSEARVEALNAALWTYDPNSFLPHGSAVDGNAERQPVWLTSSDENPNGATFLLTVDGFDPGDLTGYQRCLDLFDGNDPEAVAAARERWRRYSDAGHELAYWQQTERGWEQKS